MTPLGIDPATFRHRVPPHVLEGKIKFINKTVGFVFIFTGLT
jgi:hypothetical protein